MQVDADGYHRQLLQGILDHSSDNISVEKKYKWIVSKRGRRSMRQTIVGWKFRVKWKDGTTTWISLKYLKESNPIEVAEYVTARSIQDEPAFVWWVPFTLINCDRIISGVNLRTRKATHKYVIEIPTSIKHEE